MMITELAANTRFSRKTLAVIFLILSFFVLIDVVVSTLVDVYYDFTTSPAGKSLYVAVNIVLAVGTYVILKMTGNKIRGRSTKQTRENKIAKGVWAIYYLMIAIMAFVILQLLFFSEYYTGLLSIAPTISYGLAVFLMGLLAYHFFSWFARNKASILTAY
jgi:hypothetical protein